jgi:DNA invertase Pin-like site-specific DNA recombinase
VNGEHKITGSHRERAALIYPRQSTMAQVREHTESTRSQYALADKAAALGWPRTSIEVIDADLGVSGKWGVPREGFTELVTWLCSGDVGAIFGTEITRLARSNADVARLAEFARITGTLLIDPDGVYDPADVNDRVLLGFKGTMGELHVMAQRLHANKRAAAGRGELRTPLPVGLVHDDADDIVIDPGAEVQAAILGDPGLEHPARAGRRDVSTGLARGSGLGNSHPSSAGARAAGPVRQEADPGLSQGAGVCLRPSQAVRTIPVAW